MLKRTESNVLKVVLLAMGILHSYYILSDSDRVHESYGSQKENKLTSTYNQFLYYCERIIQ